MDGLIQIELCSDHVMYVHRPSWPVKQSDLTRTSGTGGRVGPSRAPPGRPPSGIEAARRRLALRALRRPQPTKAIAVLEGAHRGRPRTATSRRLWSSSCAGAERNGRARSASGDEYDVVRARPPEAGNT